MNRKDPHQKKNSSEQAPLTELNVWAKYIEAQSKVLERLSQPIAVASSEINENYLQVELKPHDDRSEIIRRLRNEVKVEEKHIHFDEGYFAMPNDKPIASEKIDQLNQILEANYARIIPKPGINGYFIPTGATLSNIIASLIPDEQDRETRFSADGDIYLTLKEIGEIDQLLSGNKEITRDARIGCVYKYQLIPLNPLKEEIQNFTKSKFELSTQSNFNSNVDLTRQFALNGSIRFEGLWLEEDIEARLSQLCGLERKEVKLQITDSRNGELVDSSNKRNTFVI